jgi:5-methylcytosine-specific restriction endonuclease McrA
MYGGGFKMTMVDSREEWRRVVRRYATHLGQPCWRGRTVVSRGVPAAARATDATVRRVEGALEELVNKLPGNTTPARVSAIQLVLQRAGHDGRRFDKCPKAIWHLWRALVFDRDNYTCTYCGRHSEQLLEKEGRVLRLELDHVSPRAAGSQCDDFDALNIVTACRSCNVMKGQMDERLFRLELDSLARSVQRQRR